MNWQHHRDVWLASRVHIYKREQPGWTTLIFHAPSGFLRVSLVSNFNQLALKAFREREMKRYKNLITITAALGILFVILQWIGFSNIWNSGVTFHGSGAGQFLYVIAGLHALHVIAGVIALIVMFIKAFSKKIRSYNSIPVEVVNTCWHFVNSTLDIFVHFLLWIRDFEGLLNKFANQIKQ